MRSLRGSRLAVSLLMSTALTLTLSTLAGEVASASRQAADDGGYPIDLPNALRLAGAENLDVQIAQERLAAALAADESALLQFFPWASVGASYRRHENRIQDVAGNMIDADKQAYAPGVVIVAQVDMGDAIYKKLAARQLVTAAREALEVQRQDSILAAATGYLDLARAHANVGVAREALRISQEYQRQLQEAVTAGIAFRGDELRVQVQTQRYGIALRQALELERTAAASLARTLHLDPVLVLVPRDSDPVSLTLVPPTSPLSALVEQALASRSELRQSGAVISAADATKKGTRYGPLIPSISAQAFVGGLGGGKQGSTGNFGESEDYGVFLGWRIGTGGLFDSGRIKAADARLVEARLTEKKVRDQIVQQVVESHTRAASLADQINATRTNLATATDALRLTMERKEFAIGAVLEVIQAQQELTRTRYEYLSTIAEYDKAQYALGHALATYAPRDGTGAQH